MSNALPAALLTDSDIFALRSSTQDCEVSRLCSQALWGETSQARSGARRALARMVAS